MKKIIRYTMLATVVMCCSTAVAQQPLSMEDCRAMALDNSTRSRVAELTSEKASHTAKAMLTNFFPKFTVKGTYAYMDNNFKYTIKGGYLPTFVPNLTTGGLDPNLLTVGGQPVKDAAGNYIFNSYAFMPDIDFNLKFGSIYNARIEVEQPIFVGGKIIAGYTAAKIGERIATQNQRMAVLETILQSDEAYLNCVRATELLKAAISYRTTVEALLTTVTNALDVGFKTSDDVLKVQIALDGAMLDVVRAENAVRLSKMNLCYVLGMPMNGEVEIQESVALPEESVTDDVNVEKRPEWAMLTDKIDLTKQQARIVQADFLPQLGIVASYGYTNGVTFNSAKVFNQASWVAMASLSIPLCHWGESIHKIKAAQIERQIAEAERDDVERQMSLEVTKCANDCREASLVLGIAQRNVAQTALNSDNTSNRYQAGVATITDLLEAKTRARKAACDEIEARASLRLGYVRFMKAAGLLDEGYSATTPDKKHK